MKIYVQWVTIDKQFVKVSLTKAVCYVYTCVYINKYVYTYIKAFIKEKIVKGTLKYNDSIGKLCRTGKNTL